MNVKLSGEDGDCYGRAEQPHRAGLYKHKHVIGKHKHLIGGEKRKTRSLVALHTRGIERTRGDVSCGDEKNVA